MHEVVDCRGIRKFHIDERDMHQTPVRREIEIDSLEINNSKMRKSLDPDRRQVDSNWDYTWYDNITLMRSTRVRLELSIAEYQSIHSPHWNKLMWASMTDTIWFKRDYLNLSVETGKLSNQSDNLASPNGKGWKVLTGSINGFLDYQQTNNRQQDQIDVCWCHINSRFSDFNFELPIWKLEWESNYWPLRLVCIEIGFQIDWVV